MLMRLWIFFLFGLIWANTTCAQQSQCGFIKDPDQQARCRASTGGVLRNADSSGIQICRLIVAQAQAQGRALADLFVTQTCNRCVERSTGVVQVSAASLETLTSKPFVVQ